ncbi:ABC transporter permease [Ramlibacter sp.]|uniref:MlaE family ABC transporter permease n=1 Tax=Ramlibacter sp. TaxID=1917967 RepID=UPI002BDBBD62|nr:ABC transporter permease [Ramlibacter sp.]HWI83739.1 ABC transporter permease [Ramlibacter sp.]
MSDHTPRIHQQPAAEGGRLLVAGQWTAAQFARPRLLRSLEASLRPAPGWDLTGAEQLDHIGAQWLWDHWGREWPQQLELLPPQRAVLERVARFTVAPPVRRRAGLRDAWLAFGGAVLRGGSHVRAFVLLIGELALNLVRLATAPHLGPWRDFSGHLYRIGGTSLPITALVGFLIGVVLAYLTSQQLKQFGADSYIVNILGIAVIRELGPLLAAILIAGRSGSAITAQIGVMRVTDELDAMSVMGISHAFRLVMPRAMALAVAMPLISVWTTTCALVGGMIAADVSLDITPAYFLRALPEAVNVDNLVLASAKSVVFGVLIALVGCHFGLRVKPNTQSLGEGTTASVVSSITIVILVDALFAVLFKDYGI